jgi:protein transport protein YIF1
MRDGAFPDSAIARMGVEYGQQLLGNGQSQISRLVSSNTLRRHFNVGHAYVAAKLRLLFFPFLHSHWRPKKDEAASRLDVSSPDLYIPAMALATYILTIGLSLGAHGRFKPDELSLTASKALFAVAAECLLIKFLFYLVDATAPLADLASISGYKYVGIAASTLIGLAVGRRLYFFANVYLALAVAFVMVWTSFRPLLEPQIKTLRFFLFVESTERSRPKDLSLLFIGLLQVPVCLWLGTAPDL